MDLHGWVPPDPETEVSRECYAVVRVGRSLRKRLPAASVREVPSAEAARDQAGARERPARVLGPSKSSEGQYIYYLLEWL